MRSEDLLRGLLIIPRGLRDHAAEGHRPDPSPERACAIGTVPGAVQSPRLAGGRRKASGPEFSALRDTRGELQAALQRLLRPIFG